MKKTLLCIGFLLITYLSCLSQTKQRKVVPVLKQQVLYLNGGFRASVGGKSRAFIEVKLPPNTVEWYYTITTFEGGKTDASLNLVPQLTMALDPSGITSIVAEALLAPSGSKVCDVYLMDWPNTTSFLNKVDLNGGRYFYNRSAVRQNFRSGVVQVKDALTGSWFLGFKNPSETQGIGIAVEVAAIVEEVSGDTKKGVLYGNMAWSAFESGDVDRCIELSKKALTVDSTLGYVKANLGLCYLIKNEEITATDYYVAALTDIKSLPNKAVIRKQLNDIIDDLNNTNTKYPDLKGRNYIKEMLEKEVKNYSIFAGNF